MLLEKLHRRLPLVEGRTHLAIALDPLWTVDSSSKSLQSFSGHGGKLLAKAPPADHSVGLLLIGQVLHHRQCLVPKVEAKNLVKLAVHNEDLLLLWDRLLGHHVLGDLVEVIVRWCRREVVDLLQETIPSLFLREESAEVKTPVLKLLRLTTVRRYIGKTPFARDGSRIIPRLVLKRLEPRVQLPELGNHEVELLDGHGHRRARERWEGDTRSAGICAPLPCEAGTVRMLICLSHD